MADIKMPPSIPCRFDEVWQGKCAKPSTNGFCTEHEGKTCASCGKLAVRSCEHTGSLVCGASLCNDCCHAFNGRGHGAKAMYQQKLQEAEREEREIKESRTSPVQRRDSTTNLPVNLFELLKGDWRAEGFHLERCYLLMLSHDLMGFFPAIIKGVERTVVTTDKHLLQEVWKTLPPRGSVADSFVGYVHAEKGIVYRYVSDQFEMERMKPVQLLSRPEYERLVGRKDEGGPFEWRPGIFGVQNHTPEGFLRMIEEAVKKLV